MALLTEPSSPSRRDHDAALPRHADTARTSHPQNGYVGHAMCILGIVLGAVVLNGWAVFANVIVAQEYQVKAIFLYNFVQFVTWPTTAFPGPHTPFTIGILGDDPFGPFLEDAVRGEVIEGRSVRIERFTRVEEASGSHILFVSKSERGNLGQILAAIQGRSILTVGETEAFARKGGMINFIAVDNKVRYEINVEAAKRANLDISSKLLKLAKIVGSALDH